MPTLISTSDSSALEQSLEPLLVAIQSTNIPFNPEEHVLFQPEMFPDGKGSRVLFPPQVYEAIDLLWERFGIFYTYEELRRALVDNCIKLKYDASPPTPPAVATSLVSTLNQPSDSLMLPPMTFFVPLSGIETSEAIPLGTATVIRPDDAEEFARKWRHERGLPEGMERLPPVRPSGGAYAQVAVGQATNKRHDELLQQYTEEAVNLLRHWMHHIANFEQFYNRPHIGGDPPTVNVHGLAATQEKRVIGTSLYLYSLGFYPIGLNEIRRMMLCGLADMIAWKDAPSGSARYATIRAARQLGHAWSQFSVEDRVMASFSALDGWLKAEHERHDVGRILGRRLGVLNTSIFPTKRFADDFYNQIYSPIRSAVAHGQGLKPRFLRWVDRIVVHFGVTAMHNAIPIIRKHPEPWTLDEFQQELDSLQVT
jgi:hypothetical protein